MKFFSGRQTMKAWIALALAFAMAASLPVAWGAAEEAASITLYAYDAAETLPRIYIDTEDGLALDDPSLVIPGVYKGTSSQYPAYDYVNAAVTVTDCEGFELDGTNAQVKIRGNYTSSTPKKPIRIKFAKKQAMCGLNGGNAMKSWVLLAEYIDSTLLHNCVGLYIANSLYSTTGNFASDFRTVEVYLNGEYNGVYVLAEQQQVNKYRVHLPQPEDPEDDDLETMTEEELAALKDGHTGYLIEFDGYYFNENPEITFTIRYDWVTRLNGETFLAASDANAGTEAAAALPPVQENNGASGGRQNNGVNSQGGQNNAGFGGGWGMNKDGALGTTRKTGFTIKSDFYFEEQRAFIQRTVQTVWDVLYDAVYTDHSDLAAHPFHTMDGDGNYIAAPHITTAYDAIAAVVDVDSLIDMYIIQEIAMDSDLDWSSFFFSIDMSPQGNHLLTYTAPWDFDNGFKTYYDAGSLFAANSDNPWLALFSNQPWFWQRLNARWDEAREAGVFAGALEMVDTLSRVHEAAYERNRERWSTGSANGASRGGSTGGAAQTQAQAAESLHAWLETKIQNVDRLIDEIANQFAE